MKRFETRLEDAERRAGGDKTPQVEVFWGTPDELAAKIEAAKARGEQIKVVSWDDIEPELGGSNGGDPGA